MSLNVSTKLNVFTIYYSPLKLQNRQTQIAYKLKLPLVRSCIDLSILISRCPILPESFRLARVFLDSHRWTVGLNWMSIVGFPSKSTYCVRICPFSSIVSISLVLATNLPSPLCEIGTVSIFNAHFPSQGDLVEQTFVLTSLDWCLPILLNVSVGLFSFCTPISPYGSNPSD